MEAILDLHTHTIMSGHAFSTIQELIQEASLKGIKYLGITDHGVARPDGPKIDYFKNLIREKKLNFINGVKVLKGVEANIINTYGELDISEAILNNLELVIAGIHNATGYGGASIKENTKAIVNTLKRNKIHILSHIGDPRFPFPVDLEECIKAAKESNVIVEINESALRNGNQKTTDHYKKMLEGLIKHNMPILLSSDAHISYAVGDFTGSLKLLEYFNLGLKDTLNVKEEFVLELIKSKEAGKNH